MEVSKVWGGERRGSYASMVGFPTFSPWHGGKALQTLVQTKMRFLLVQLTQGSNF